jgi:uncharacterized membrane protein
MTSSLRYKLIIAFSLIGTVIASYLAYYYIYGTPVPCTTHGCDIVRQSQYTKLFGISMPLYGVAFYLTFALGGLLALLHKKVPYHDLLLKIAGLWGFAFSLYLTYLEAYVIEAWCIWCVASAIIATLLFITTLLTKPFSKSTINK